MAQGFDPRMFQPGAGQPMAFPNMQRLQQFAGGNQYGGAPINPFAGGMPQAPHFQAMMHAPGAPVMANPFGMAPQGSSVFPQRPLTPMAPGGAPVMANGIGQAPPGAAPVMANPFAATPQGASAFAPRPFTPMAPMQGPPAIMASPGMRTLPR